MAITTVVFDAYGTLLDVAAPARRLAARPGFEMLGECWPELARIWREKQLQYTWLRSVAGQYCDFQTVTEDGLDYALEALKLDPSYRGELLALYQNLECFAEAPSVLTAVKQAGLNTAILSNGTPEMLQNAVHAGGIANDLDAVLSVESVGIFKPHARVYDMVRAHFGCTSDQVLFVSSNGWDAAGAAGYGFQTVWVNRNNDPVDRLYARPDHILPDLTGVPDLVT